MGTLRPNKQATTEGCVMPRLPSRMGRPACFHASNGRLTPKSHRASQASDKASSNRRKNSSIMVGLTVCMRWLIRTNLKLDRRRVFEWARQLVKRFSLYKNRSSAFQMLRSFPISSTSTVAAEGSLRPKVMDCGWGQNLPLPTIFLEVGGFQKTRK